MTNEAGGHVLQDRDGALADERDRHRVGTHTVARDAAGRVGGVEECRSELALGLGREVGAEGLAMLVAVGAGGVAA